MITLLPLMIKLRRWVLLLTFVQVGDLSAITEASWSSRGATSAQSRAGHLRTDMPT